MIIAESYSTLRPKLGTGLRSPDSQSCALPAGASATKLHRSVLSERQCPAFGEGPKRGLRKRAQSTVFHARKLTQRAVRFSQTDQFALMHLS